ncbi:hypothetical protein Dimus_035470 [Dionaea muscipula]
MAVAPPKPEEISHPPMDQLQGLEYCIDSNPSWGETVALGFQHYILALGTAVMIPSFLVPWMGGTDEDKAKVVQTMLFVRGINTLLQTLFGTRLPTVIGGSYAYMVPILSIIHDSSLERIELPALRFRNTMKAVQGSLIVALSIQIILGYSQLWAICSRRGLDYSIEVSLWLADVLKLVFPCLSFLLPSLSATSWIRVPYPLQWGAPSFSANHAFGMMAAVVVSLVESTGAYKAAARLASATPPPAHVLSRGIGWRGNWDLIEWTLWNIEWLSSVCGKT